MATDITLSKGVRQNLLSLQGVADLLNRTQERLASGKKVNSALDNPINFFTSSGLSSRASDLSRLLDSVGNAIQTLQAADKGISSIQKLIESAKATANQALTASLGDATYATTVTGNTAIAVDSSRATSSADFATAAGGSTASVQSSYVFDYANSGLTGDGRTLRFQFGNIDVRFENDQAGDGVAAGNVSFVNGTTAAQFRDMLRNYFGTANVAESGGVITITGNYTNSFTVTPGGGATVSGQVVTNHVDGSKLTITQGAVTKEYRYTAAAGVAANGTFNTLTELVAALNHANGQGAGFATDAGGGIVRFDSANAFTVGGAFATPFGINGTFANNYNSTLAGITGTLSLTLGSGSAQTINFGTVTTRAALVNALNGLSGVTASINGSNQIAISWSTSDSLTISGTGSSATGLFAGANIGENAAVQTGGGTSAARASLQADYNGLLAQITQLARDASFNGVNLLNNDNLTVVFNENGSSTLQITGVDFTAAGLQLTTLNGAEFQTNGGVNTAIGELDAAIQQLRTQASKFGSNNSIVQTRQDFTKNLISVLQIGADNLVLADTNEEGANMLALNTRQQLSTVALSLAAQADQNVLRLF